MENLKLSEEYSFKVADTRFQKNLGYFLIKRVIDIVGALTGLILLSPVMLLTAIAIKLDSKGPILFAQERVGKNGKLFKMYKFRSMITNAEDLLDKLQDKNEMSGPMFKIKDDPRITKVGKLIRKTSIDELPQLINILKGEMSLVGPRPNLPKEVDQFTAFQMQKLIAKPGLTCYWQVMGRSNIDFEEWMKLDVKYVEERNTWVDIKLVLRLLGFCLVMMGRDRCKECVHIEYSNNLTCKRRVGVA